MNNSPVQSGPHTTASSPTDEHLMPAFSQASADEFSELFSRYKQPLFGFFWRFFATRADRLGNFMTLELPRESTITSGLSPCYTILHRSPGGPHE